MGIDCASSTLKMTCRCPLFVTTTTCNYFLHEIKDEKSLEFAMATVFNVPSINAIDLYIEKVDLNYDVYPIGKNLPLSGPCRSPPLTQCTPRYNSPLQPHEFIDLVNEGRPPKLFSSGSSFGLSSSTTCGAETTDSKAKTENKTTFGNENGSPFTSFPVTSAGSSPFGFGSSVTNPMANNQSAPLFGTESGSLVSTQPSSFATGNSLFSSSISAPRLLFISGSSCGLSSSTSLSEITSVSSSSGPTSITFGSSWLQPNKSPLFASAFSSPSVTNPMANNQSAPLFGTESGSLVSTQPSSFATGNSLFSSSISAPRLLFSSGSSFGLSSSTSSSEITSAISSSGPTSITFGSSWLQPNKSPLFASAFSSPSVTNPMANNQSAPLFGTKSGSLVSTQPSSFATGSSLFSSSISAPRLLFSSGSSFGLSSSTSSSEITSVSSSSGPTSITFGSIWQQPNKSPLFASAFSSPSAGFMLGSITPSPSNPNPFQFFGQQSQLAPQNPCPFQATSSLGFNAGGSSSSGSDGGDKSARRMVRASKSRNRKR